MDFRLKAGPKLPTSSGLVAQFNWSIVKRSRATNCSFISPDKNQQGGEDIEPGSSFYTCRIRILRT